MAYDAYSRVYRPDMQAELPQWIPMGDDQNQQAGQDIGSMMGLLRQRIGAKPTGKGNMPMGGAEGKALMGGAGKAGGMQSL